MRILDGKYHLEGDQVIKTTNGTVVPENEPLFLLRARDKNAIPTLKAYRRICELDNCNDYQIQGIDTVIKKFEDFKEANQDVMKQPGITRGK